jgi:hypothetical protein
VGRGTKNLGITIVVITDDLDGSRDAKEWLRVGESGQSIVKKVKANAAAGSQTQQRLVLTATSPERSPF